MDTQQVGPFSISSASLTTRRSAQLDMNYYLTTGLEGVERQEYRSIRSFSRAIDSRHDEFHSGNRSVGQYLVFVSVTKEHIASIHHLRDIRRRNRGINIMYLKNQEVLIVKINLSGVPGMVHGEFRCMLYKKTIEMGLLDDLFCMGRTTFEGIIGQKEADSTFKPSVRRMAVDWPTLVFECGPLQSLERLRVESHWWLENSTEVKIVLLFAVSEADKRIHLEQGEIITPPNSRVTGPQPDPLTTRLAKTNEIDIVAGVASGSIDL